MAAKGGRLDKKSLEQALEDAFNDQQGDGNPATEDQTKAGGVDPSFIASLQVKLAGQGEDFHLAEGSGVKAPASTRMLSPAEIAALNQDDDEEAMTRKVTVGATSGSNIDQVDSKLVTELNKKLSDEAARGSRAPAADRGTSGPSTDLQAGELFAALEKHADSKASGSADVTGTLDRRFPDIGMVDGPPTSGLRAPQPTAKLSKDMLASLDNAEEVAIVATTRGNLQGMDNNLVGELQRKLGGIEADETVSAGFRAPSNTVILPADIMGPQQSRGGGAVDAGFLSELQQKLAGDDDQTVDNVQLGCRAPQPTVKLSQDMLAGLSDDEGVPDVAAGASAALNMKGDPGVSSFGADDQEDCEQVVRGAKAPRPTQLITAEMLAGLQDEDDIAIAPDPFASGAMLGQNSGPAASSAPGFNPNFADSLSRKLQGAEATMLPSMTTGKGGDSESGFRAPASTQKLSADQLAYLDDEDIPPVDNRNNQNRMGMPQGMIAQVGSQPVSADMLAGLQNAGPSVEQLATLSAARAAMQEVVPFYSPSQDQQCTEFALESAQNALTMDNTSATKVINTLAGVASMRGMPDSTAMWGQPRPPTSSCKLRLAWLSKDEVRKENEQLKREISSLRAEINMHRKEATLARKA